MTSAISSACAPRPSRVVSARASMRSDFSVVLNTGPGATALTRTPCGLNSAAHERVSEAKAALGAP